MPMPAAMRKAVRSTAQSRTVRRVRIRSSGRPGSAIADGSSQRYSVRVMSTKLRSRTAGKGSERRGSYQSRTLRYFRRGGRDRWLTRRARGGREARPMKKIVETIGFLVFIQGVGGLLYEWTGWFRFWTLVRHIDFLSDRMLFVNIVLVVAGAAVMIAADSIRT